MLTVIKIVILFAATSAQSTENLYERFSAIEKALLAQQISLNNQSIITEDLKTFVLSQNAQISRLSDDNEELKAKQIHLETLLLKEKFDRTVKEADDSDTNSKSEPEMVENRDEIRQYTPMELMSNNNNHLASLIQHNVKRQTVNAAFHVYLSGDRCFQDDEQIVFDTTEIDYGYGYTVQNGIYHVRAGGVYVFTWTIVAQKQQHQKTEIVINGVSKGMSISDSDLTGDFHPTTSIVVVHVNTGDHVVIRKVSGNGCEFISTHGRTSFSGWRLF